MDALILSVGRKESSLKVLTDVVADLRLELLHDPGLVVVLGLEELLLGGEQVVEMSHPDLHVVLEKLGQVLVVRNGWINRLNLTLYLIKLKP